MATLQNIPGSIPNEKVEQMTFDLPTPQPIKGFPELRWAGKRPFTSTHYFPAQLKEQYGDPIDGWMNRIYWGDNLQVMGHLLREFRGKVDLVYIDPPFDSNAAYTKKIITKKGITLSDYMVFEEKQYNDIWNNDNFLQFIYERLILLKELLSSTGIIVIHLDHHMSYYIRCLLDEIFSRDRFINEIIWHYKTFQGQTKRYLPRKHDNIIVYSKSATYAFNKNYDTSFDETGDAKRWSAYFDDDGCIYGNNMPVQDSRFMRYLNKWKSSNNGKEPTENDLIYKAQGQLIDSVWEMKGLDPKSGEKNGYPTQKPEHLLSRIVESFSNPGAIVFDCFMGSGTTQAVAMKLGRRFIGADINLGAVQTTTRRLNQIIKEQKEVRPSLILNENKQYLNFEVYNVNNYDIFRNPAQAKELLLEALEIDQLQTSEIFDGMKDGYKVKIMPVNRIATRADLNPIISGINYRELDKKLETAPGAVLDRIMLVCMGHEPDLAAHLQMEIGKQYRIEVQVVDILREKERGLTFKYDSEADITVEDGELIIKQFYPRNLLQKLSLLEENVEEWRELVDTVAIDWNYNGEVLSPAVYDNPGKDKFVQGRYAVPEDHGIIRVKITDLLSESLEMSLEVE